MMTTQKSMADDGDEIFVSKAKKPRNYYNKHGGRPLHDYWKEANFEAIYIDKKIIAKCLVCEKELRNTAKARLQRHRKTCLSNIDILKTFKQETFEEYKIQETNTFANAIINTSDNPYAFDSNEEQMPEAEEHEAYATQPIIVSLPDGTSFELPQDPKEPQKFTQNIQIVTALETPTHTVTSSSSLPPEIEIKQEKTDLDIALAEFVYSSNIPLLTVSSSHFKKFLKAFCPSYEIPKISDLSSTLLDKVKENIKKEHNSIREQNSILVITTHKENNKFNKYYIACLYNEDGTRIFLNIWEIEDTIGITSPSDTIIAILSEAINLAKTAHNVNIYGVISEDDYILSKIRDNFSNIWHSSCNCHCANLLAADVVSNDLVDNTIRILKEFENPNLEKLLTEHGGGRIILPLAGRWCTYRDSFQCLLNNYEIMRNIFISEQCTVKPEILNLLFNDEFIGRLQISLEALRHICKLIYKTQIKTTTLADIAEDWLRLKLPEQFQTNLESRKCTALSINAMAANMIHPEYRGQLLSPTQVEQVEVEFFLENLDSKGLDDLFTFRANGGYFGTLNQQNISDPKKFWLLANSKHPELSQTAIKLIQMPASSLHIRRLFASWLSSHINMRNLIGWEKSKKFIQNYFNIKLMSNSYVQI